MVNYANRSLRLIEIINRVLRVADSLLLCVYVCIREVSRRYHHSLINTTLCINMSFDLSVLFLDYGHISQDYSSFQCKVFNTLQLVLYINVNRI